MADSVSGKHLISRHVLAERYNILDTILNSSNTNLNESIILKAYEFPGLNITIESPETGSNETFLYWGFIKQKLITVVDFTCHYEKNKNPHMIMSKSETKSYTEKTFFFWSIVILFILFWFGAWLYSLIYKIIKGKKIDFALDTAGEVIAYLIFFWITVASINQSIKCGPKFCLIALFAFLLPAITSLIIKLKPKK